MLQKILLTIFLLCFTAPVLAQEQCISPVTNKHNENRIIQNYVGLLNKSVPGGVRDYFEVEKTERLTNIIYEYTKYEVKEDEEIVVVELRNPNGFIFLVHENNCVSMSEGLPKKLQPRR